MLKKRVIRAVFINIALLFAARNSLSDVIINQPLILLKTTSYNTQNLPPTKFKGKIMQKRPIFDVLLKRIQEPRRFIQVLLGPRQVGKTTLALQVTEELNKPFHFVSADLATLQDHVWLRQQWEVARGKVGKENG